MKQVSVEIIHKCPNYCMHCSSFSGMTCTMKIPKEKVFEIIEGMVKIGMEVLNISGGEPFLHDGLAEIVKYAKANKIHTYIYTSGIMLNHKGNVCELEDCLLDRLKEFGADKLIFDLPSMDEKIYDVFMGTERYQRFALSSIQRSVKKGIFTEIHFVPTKINITQIDKVIDFAKEIGVDRVSFLGLVPHGRAKQNQETLYLSKEETDRLKQKLFEMASSQIRIGIPLQLDNSEYKCYAGRQKLCVKYDGKVFGCEAFKYIVLKDDQGNEIEPDSIYEKSIDEIYHNSLYLRQERDFIAEQMACSNCNEKCPVQRMMRKVI